MIVFIQSRPRCRESRVWSEVERPSKLLGHQPIDFRVALLDRQRGQVDSLERNRPAVVDHLNRLAIDDLDKSPQNLVSLDHNVKRLFQEPDVEFPVETDRIPLVISAHRRGGVARGTRASPGPVRGGKCLERSLAGNHSAVDRLIPSFGKDSLEGLSARRQATGVAAA